MLAFIGLIVLLQFLGPGPLDAGALLRVCVYGGLGTTRQRVNRLFWGYAVLVALCMIFALTLQHAP